MPMLRDNALQPMTRQPAAGPCLFPRWPPSWQPHGSQSCMLEKLCRDLLNLFWYVVCNIAMCQSQHLSCNKEYQWQDSVYIISDPILGPSYVRRWRSFWARSYQDEVRVMDVPRTLFMMLCSPKRSLSTRCLPRAILLDQSTTRSPPWASSTRCHVHEGLNTKLPWRRFQGTQGLVRSC